ncbi:unnamed protein product, partial [Schistocephalus solidus]|uniref:Endo/exonuclease/phosphatase domain-containing protein n=1 Tax=Schistocephalus solidus TaxID=70667 RepID=A0A183SAG3_SCHSO
SCNLECSFPFRKSEEQPIVTEDGASCSGTGALQGGHHHTQRNPILRVRPTGGVTSSNEAKKIFYEDLHARLAIVPKLDKLIVLGDFTVHIGTHHAICREVLGPHDFNDFDDNSLLLLRFCAVQQLILTNPFFSLPIFTRRPGCTSVRDTGTCCIRSSSRAIRRPAYHLHFSNELANCLATLPVASEDFSMENRWCQLRDTIQSISLDIICRERRQDQG